jgi:hypothetical protein
MLPALDLPLQAEHAGYDSFVLQRSNPARINAAVDNSNNEEVLEENK